jgi:putative ABC transport system permease protein
VLKLALRTLRARPAGLLGSLLALTLGVALLTVMGRALAPPGDGRDLAAVYALFGTAGGVSAFVCVFVVASTFGFAVAQRRREFGLLRVAGATRGQVRRMVLAEALAVGVLGSCAGCVAGAYAAPYLVARVVAAGLAPRGYGVGGAVWPYAMAGGTGLLVALCGAVAAAWRAGRTSPVEALREAAAEGRTMPLGRLLWAAALLLTAAALSGLSLARDPGELLHRKAYVSRPMLLISGVALLAPAFVRPLARLLGALPARLPGAAGRLVRATATAGPRRTAAVAAPVLVTVTLAGSLLGATATVRDAQAAEARARTAAAFVVTPADAAGFDAADLARLRAVPGAVVSPTAGSTVQVVEDGTALITSRARAAEPGPLAATTRLPLAAGRLADLDDGSIVVNEEWQRHAVGARVRVRLADGMWRTLRIAAVMHTGTGGNGVYVTPRNAPGARVDRVDVALAAGADARTVAAALRTAVRGGTVRTGPAWLRATASEGDRTTRLGLLLVLGLALLYTAVALVNTTVMAMSQRTRELAVLRLAGATRAQVLGVVAGEALLTTALGALPGAAVAAANLAGMAAALHRLSAPVAFALPWRALAATSAVCAALAVAAALAAAAVGLSRRPVEAAGVPD